jgi:hypothetical protein
MGYYTSYNLTVTKREGLLFEEVGREIEVEIAKKLCAISDWFESSDFNKTVKKSDYPLAKLIGFDPIKWYNHYDEMVVLSTEFPSLYFELKGLGEDYEDMWREYFHNGEAMHSDAKIIYDTPNW